MGNILPETHKSQSCGYAMAYLSFFIQDWQQCKSNKNDIILNSSHYSDRGILEKDFITGNSVNQMTMLL